MDKNGLYKIFLISLIIGMTLALTACTKDIADVKDDSMMDKQVSVRGVVGNSIKIGSFTGYTLQDDTGSIGVVTSGDLPKEGSRLTVKGKLRKLFVYYIETD